MNILFIKFLNKYIEVNVHFATYQGIHSSALCSTPPAHSILSSSNRWEF